MDKEKLDALAKLRWVSQNIPALRQYYFENLAKAMSTSPTFTTPGASLDYLNGNPNRMIEYFIDMPAKRVKVLVRSTKIGFFESKCENAGFDSEWDGLNQGHSFWYATLFQGHESRDAEDELRIARLELANTIVYDSKNNSMALAGAIEKYERAIIAARK